MKDGWIYFAVSLEKAREKSAGGRGRKPRKSKPAATTRTTAKAATRERKAGRRSSASPTNRGPRTTAVAGGKEPVEPTRSGPEQNGGDDELSTAAVNA